MRVSKEQAKNALAEIQKVFLQYGVHQVSKGLYPFKLKTPFGTLFITPSVSTGDEIGAIFMRFDTLNWNKKALEEQLGRGAFNKFTGKWNILCCNPSEVESLARMFELRMELLGQKKIL